MRARRTLLATTVIAAARTEAAPASSQGGPVPSPTRRSQPHGRLHGPSQLDRAPRPCTDSDRLDEATAEITALQEELSTAAPPEKPAIATQIRQWQATLNEHQQRGTQLGCRLS